MVYETRYKKRHIDEVSSEEPPTEDKVEKIGDNDQEPIIVKKNLGIIIGQDYCTPPLPASKTYVLLNV